MTPKEKAHKKRCILWMKKQRIADHRYYSEQVKANEARRIYITAEAEKISARLQAEYKEREAKRQAEAESSLFGF